MDFDLEAVAPSAGDKYSPNLYRWLKKHKSYDIRVFRLAQEAPLSWRIGWLYDGDFLGLSLASVLAHGTRAEGFSSPASKLVEVADFWPRYVDLGRCVIDPAHIQRFVEDTGRFVTTGERRVCQWCGAVQELRRWQEVIEREAWSDVQVLAGGDS